MYYSNGPRVGMIFVYYINSFIINLINVKLIVYFIFIFNVLIY